MASRLLGTPADALLTQRRGRGTQVSGLCTATLHSWSALVGAPRGRLGGDRASQTGGMWHMVHSGTPGVRAGSARVPGGGGSATTNRTDLYGQCDSPPPAPAGVDFLGFFRKKRKVLRIA